MTLADGSLDELEKNIVLALQEDARRSFKSIATALNVSEGTISNRVNRLVKLGILKLEARVNPFALSGKVAALLGINLKHRSHERAVKAIQALPNVSSVWVTTGTYDIFVEVVADSINDLHTFLFDRGLNQIDDIEATETHIMLQSETKFFKI